MFKLIFAFSLILICLQAKSQNSPKHLKVLFNIDSFRTTGPFQVSEKITDTFSTAYCEKDIYFTITIKNISKKRLQLVKNSEVMDLRSDLFAYEIERFDSLLSKYVPLIPKECVLPIFDGQSKNLFLNPQSNLVFKNKYDYWTKLGEINRIRVVLRITKKEFSKFEIYSDWKTLIWNGIQGPGRFANNSQ
jgi:hypothetical protein